LTELGVTPRALSFSPRSPDVPSCTLGKLLGTRLTFFSPSGCRFTFCCAASRQGLPGAEPRARQDDLYGLNSDRRVRRLVNPSKIPQAEREGAGAGQNVARWWCWRQLRQRDSCEQGKTTVTPSASARPSSIHANALRTLPCLAPASLSTPRTPRRRMPAGRRLRCDQWTQLRPRPAAPQDAAAGQAVAGYRDAVTGSAVVYVPL